MFNVFLKDVRFGRALVCVAYILQKNVASPRTELHAENKTFQGRAKHKTNAKLLTPVACALFERSE